jgi:hypothetical protein
MYLSAQNRIECHKLFEFLVDMLHPDKYVAKRRERIMADPAVRNSHRLIAIYSTSTFVEDVLLALTCVHLESYVVGEGSCQEVYHINAQEK